MASPRLAAAGLAAQLDVALQLLADEVHSASIESALQAQNSAAAAYSCAMSWRADHGEEEVAALRSVINGSSARLGPVLHDLQHPMPAVDQPKAAACVARGYIVRAVMDAVSCCLSLASRCGASSEAQLQLMQPAVQWLVSGGQQMLSMNPAAAAAASGVRLLGGAIAFRSLLHLQLTLAALCLSTPVNSTAAAIQAASSAQFAAWMASVAAAVELLEADSRAAQLHREVLPLLMEVCHALSTQPAWSNHAAAVAQSRLAPALLNQCMAFVSVLAVVLPLPEGRRPARYTWDSVAEVAGVMIGTSALADALPAYLQAVDTARLAASIAAAAQIVQQLDQPPEGWSQSQHRSLAAWALQLLGGLCFPNSDTSSCRRLDSPQQQRITSQLLSVVNKLPHLLQLISGSNEAAQQASVQQLSATTGAARMCLTFLCGVLLKDMHIGSSSSSSGGSSSSQCQEAAAPMANWADAEAWCHAACGALQCLLHVQQLRDAAPHNKEPDAFVLMALGLAKLTVTHLQGACYQPSSVAPPAEMTAAVWQLHSRLAQLVQFLAETSGTLISFSDQESSGPLLFLLCECLMAAAQLHYTRSALAPTAGNARVQQDARPMQALCAAHAAALLTCEAHCSMASDDPSVAHSALQSLATVIGQGPAAVGLDPTLQRLFGQLWDIVSQQGGHAQAVVWLNVLDAAQHSVRLAAFLAACGYYDTLMALSVQAQGQVLAALRHVSAAATKALGPAKGAAGSTGSGSSTGAEAAEDAALLQQLRQDLASLEAVMPQLGASARHLKRDVLPPARRLAAALLDWWQRPAAQQEQQLEAAQAAAARSCAYLRCANLGGGGGPAAGQGEGSQRCSACRAVWYCGTACSHADWRAGHRRVCKALGAVRAAAKAARQAAAKGE